MKVCRTIAAAAALCAAGAVAGEKFDLSGGGWTCEKNGVAKEVKVPCTVEEYFADMSGYAAPETDGSRHDSWIVKEWLKLKGDSVWRRNFSIAPECFVCDGLDPNKRAVLKFEATRYFADIYVNGKKVHHDETPDTPYEVDISEAVVPGGNKLEVRIGNPPGGDYDWRDYEPCKVNGIDIPGGRAMSGITGRVELDVRDLVAIDDVYIQNTPEKTAVNAIISITNSSSVALARNLNIAVAEEGGDSPAKTFPKRALVFEPGLSVVTQRVADVEAKLWDLEHPNLYRMTVSVGGENLSKTFGYRWIAPEGIGKDAVLRLNGKRIVIRTAIGWGWYLGSGIVPSKEDAKREVAAAKALGLNAISFHRHNGQEIILEEADRQGLLVYAEPGAFQSGKETEWGQKINTQKVQRWIKAFRSHPSLFHWNLMNELWGNTSMDDYFRRSIRMAHELDPSRTITLTSAWGKDGLAVEAQNKMNMRPFDDTLHLNGWCDFHRAGGPVLGWDWGMYDNPSRHYMHTTNREEIKYWGEEGAFSAPPRLQLIVDELDRRAAAGASAPDGVDGRVFRVWADKVNAYLDRKGFRAAFPTLDSWCCALGAESLCHQGRKIEMMRMDDAADGYAVNGWESMVVENNSGIVDTMRNPKADVGIMAQYNAPLRLAVMAKPVAKIGDEIAVDVFIINEVDLKGTHALKVELVDKKSGAIVEAEEREVEVSGGETYGELLSCGIKFKAQSAGEYELCAKFTDVPEARGEAKLTVFDTAAPEFPEGYCVEIIEQAGDNRLSKWMAAKKVPFVKYGENPSGKADVIVIARPSAKEPSTVGSKYLKGAVELKWSVGGQLKVSEERAAFDFEFPAGTPPVKGIDELGGWDLEACGRFVAEAPGEYAFRFEGPVRRRDRYQFLINGEAQAADPGAEIVRRLNAGEEVELKLVLHQKQATGLKLLVRDPVPETGFEPKEILARAGRDGSRVVIIDWADKWCGIIADVAGIEYRGSCALGRDWLGGMYFTKADPLLAGFPVNCAVGAAYEDIAGDRGRSMLLMEGEECIIGAWQSENCKLGTALGRIRQGDGEIIVSSLNIMRRLGRLGADRYLFNLIAR